MNKVVLLILGAAAVLGILWASGAFDAEKGTIEQTISEEKSVETDSHITEEKEAASGEGAEDPVVPSEEQKNSVVSTEPEAPAEKPAEEKPAQ